MLWTSTLVLCLLTETVPCNGFSIPKTSPIRRMSSLSASSLADGSSGASTQNAFGVFSDAMTNSIFSLLHAFDPDPIKDSSKNLRVLWVRALMQQKGLIQDDIAATFLPKTTRGLVTTDAGASFLGPAIRFTEWIQARTEFIDNGLELFLNSSACINSMDEKLPCNVVLLGAGYDTRRIRFRNKHDGLINFMEVDLPDVCEGKKTLYDKFRREQDPDMKSSTIVALDLNECSKTRLINVLKEEGLDSSLPTFFVFEAVLFYVNRDAIECIFEDLFDYSQQNEMMLCLTDSLKPYLDVPFSNNARIFFKKNKMELLEHRARWGGAVHFCLAASENGLIKDHLSKKLGGIVNSYLPTQSNNNAILANPSFDNTWYAVAYPWQIDGYATPLDATLNRRMKERKPFATRLWGEPLVIYRDIDGDLVAMADVCPHRSVPLSMGTLNEKNELVCFYHGWKYGKNGQCVHMPTSTNPASYKKVTKTNLSNNRAVVEHQGLVYIWRGNVLEADPSLLPTRRKGDMESIPIDTAMDYNVDYSYIVENNLDSPHLFFLHDGSVPPIKSIGMSRPNLPKLKLRLFVDDCGVGHMGTLDADNGRPKKLIRFDPPNIVRHGGVSGFEEEFHIVPIAPQRTRVLLRQHLPKGPILSTITSVPLVLPFLTLLVNNWNYHIALEDSCLMQGQANRIEDWGAPRMSVGGLGDDLIKRYWTWRSKAHDALPRNENQQIISPYFNSFHGIDKQMSSIPTGTSYGDDPAIVSKVRADAHFRQVPLASDDQEFDPRTGNAVGSWGIKQHYLQDTPAANFPPINYKQYARMLVFDDIVKKLNFEQPKDPLHHKSM